MYDDDEQKLGNRRMRVHASRVQCRTICGPSGSAG
jgi:hypothetical protein